MKTSTKNAIIAAAAVIFAAIVGFLGNVMLERNIGRASSDKAIKGGGDSVNTVIINTGGDNINAGRDVNINK